MNFEATGHVNTGGTGKEISQDIYEQIKSAKSTCLFALELEEKFTLLLDNFYEFETELLKLAEASRIWPKRNHGDSMLERLSLDRRLVNLLTACRLYLDQTDHGISSLFNNPSDELSAIKSFKNHLYENHWGYRLMEALRNHVQHSGLPVHVISYSSTRVPGADADYSRYTIIPLTKVQKLSENSSFKKSILRELQSQGSQIDLRPSVNEYIECFCRLHERLRETIETKLTTDRLVYESAVKEYSTIRGKAVRFPHLVMKNNNGTTSEEVILVSDFLKHLDYFRNRNRTNRNFLRTFSANTEQKPAR